MFWNTSYESSPVAIRRVEPNLKACVPVTYEIAPFIVGTLLTSSKYRLGLGARYDTPVLCSVIRGATGSTYGACPFV